MIRIHFSYRHVDVAWGGANNFIRALRNELLNDSRFVFTDSIDDPCDVVFMNQLGKGPGGDGKRYTLDQVRSWQSQGRRIAVRAVNLNRHAFRPGLKNLTLGWLEDRRTIELLNLADAVIFQSDYQRRFFVKAGFRGLINAVIHNGAAQGFWVDKPTTLPLGARLRFVSSTASPRKSKRHALIARLSLCEGVEVTHIGSWPEDLPSEKVHLMGTLSHEEMVRVLVSAHYFFHPAIQDPCPNAIFEAVCAGLPVVYNPGPGSSEEIVGICGLPLEEKNLDATVAAARSRYSELKSLLLRERQRYSIDAAMPAYRDVILRLAGKVGAA